MYYYMPYKYVEKEIYLGAGIYCFYPFDSGLVANKGVFKIGMTTSFERRTSSYHTYMPEGVYVVAMFTPRKNKRQDEYGEEGLSRYYRRIEKQIFKDIIARGGEMVTMNIRTNGGKTEWVFADFNILEDAFDKAKEEFGGKLEMGNLDHLPVPDASTPYFEGCIKFY